MLASLIISACVTTEDQAQQTGVKIDPSIIAVSTPGVKIPQGAPMYEKGTMMMYVFDNWTSEVIWRSAVQAAVDFSMDTQERKERLEPIIRDMFRSLPIE